MVVRCGFGGSGKLAAFLPAKKTRAAKQASKAALFSDRQELGLVTVR